MSDYQSGGIAGFVTSMIIAVLALLGINKKIDKKMDISAFEQFEKAQDTAHADIKLTQIETNKKLDKIFSHMPKRNTET